MSRYIDADKLIDTIELAELPVIARSVLTKCMIPNQPTADVVEVVRCKNCKHATENKSIKAIYDCDLECGFLMRADDYCSFGERAEQC